MKVLGRSAIAAFFVLLPCISFAAPQKVSFKTRDGVILKGLFEKPKPGKPVVILLHGLGSSKEEWGPFFEALVQQGWGALSYDARGHGESSITKDENGFPNGYKQFGNPGPGSPWEKMINDVGSAVVFLKVDRKLTNNKIFLTGASLGANVALTYTSLTKLINGVVLLSPGLNYAEIKTEQAISKLRPNTALMVASEGDQYSFESCRQLVAINKSVPFWWDVNPGHGVQMLDQALIARILQWMGKK